MKHLSKVNTKPKRVVILGAFGVIGKSLTRHLENENIEVLALGRKQMDLSQKDSVLSLSSMLKPTDCVVFLATISPAKGKGVDAFFQNIQLAKNFCKALEQITPAHVVYLSSDSVYSLQKQEIITETSPTSPDDLYGVMHLSREFMIRASSNAPIAILRSTMVLSSDDTHNSYGPNRIRRSAQREKKITLFGSGEETRDHILAEDVACLIGHVLSHRSVGILNLATGQSISYMDLSKKIVDLFDDTIEIVCTPRKNRITHRHFDVSSIYKSFPFFTFHSLDEGLAKVHKEEKS